ncbi:DUF4190 domain-containing protein [Streptomyces sp. NPDC089799]|uniref:DUF4190 domain-containing protein n=1 Tax=Streptomyces sp. NPDC089799 TaxID=3155066 RepID=UPI0034297E66
MSTPPPPPPPPPPEEPPRWGPPYGQPGKPGGQPQPDWSGQPGQPGRSAPPGQPGQPPPSGPYGGPQGQGWSPPPGAAQKTNTLAIVAFVMAIVCAIPFVPLVLGIVALSQIAKRGEKGRGFAIAAIVIHSLTLVFLALGLAFGFNGLLNGGPPPERGTSGEVTGAGSGNWTELRPGDCFNTDEDLSESREGTTQEVTSWTVDIVPCDRAHEGETYAVVDLEDGPYPGSDEIKSIAAQKCSDAVLTAYVGDPAKLPETLVTYHQYPTSTGWDETHKVLCYLADRDGAPTTGSVRATTGSAS